MKPLTEHIPKAMAPVCGKPFLNHFLTFLKAQEVHDIVLCTGYLGDQIEKAFGDGKELGIRIRYSKETGALLGTGGALKQARELLDESFFVTNGDTFITLDWKEIYRSFVARGKKALMVVTASGRASGAKNNVNLDGDLMVTSHDKEGAGPSMGYVDAGVIVLKRESLDLIPGEGTVSLEEGLYQSLIRRRELAGLITRERFYDIGSVAQLAEFEQYLMKRRN